MAAEIGETRSFMQARKIMMHRKLIALQGLRAFAAAIVVLVHAQATYLEKVGNVADGLAGLPAGSFGVRLFFCISGFIIFSTAISTRNTPACIGLFAWRRLIRIVPLYWLATAVYAVRLALRHEAPGMSEFLMSIFFVPYGDHQMRPVLGVGWTLNYEMFFYLVFGCALWLRERHRLVAMLAFFVSLRLLNMAGLFDADSRQPLEVALFYFSDGYLDYFVLGLVLGAARKRYLEAGGTLFLRPGVAVLGSLAALCAWLSVMHLAKWTGWMREAATLMAVATGVSICLFERATSGVPVSRLRGVLQTAGDASYSTYLTHGFVMGPAARLLKWSGFDLSGSAFALLMVPVCSAAGILVFRSFEQPLISCLTPTVVRQAIRGAKNAASAHWKSRSATPVRHGRTE